MHSLEFYNALTRSCLNLFQEIDDLVQRRILALNVFQGQEVELQVILQPNPQLAKGYGPSSILWIWNVKERYATL